VNQSFHFNDDSFKGDSISLFKKNGDLSFFNKIMLNDNNWSFIEMEIGMSLSVWFDEKITKKGEDFKLPSFCSTNRISTQAFDLKFKKKWNLVFLKF
jgi:hypothetical protein